ncbi:NADH-quinone oxidoreductase subunit NuoE [Nocardia transvalensis]|uniref:NADH-quinone oxidoreductase subunit NuoE n=1 Tax=Nocardia transvalensis TaxID=37333 RepID=UPI001892FD85|nr:NADH-quinone oxidoreductase subunit NuoE [Nocardia transvalensis]MBF6328150.1 NADH-quinone oxidoreductase subunit NuoE [Nocardia transvalensis]
MTEILVKLSERPIPYPQQVRDKLQLEAKEIIERYPHPRSALLPLLHLVQAVEGYVSRTGIGFCAEQLGLTDAEVAAVATFYSMYRRTPTGDYHVGVCTNTLCAVMGGDQILATLKEHLGIGHGETTGDGAITLEHIECNAACDYAPVLTVNWEFFDNQTPESARALVDSLRRGEQVTGSRSGVPLCTFRETARILAGFPDERPGANDGEPGEATLAGLRIARSTAVPEQPLRPGLAEKRGESRDVGRGEPRDVGPGESKGRGEGGAQ